MDACGMVRLKKKQDKNVIFDLVPNKSGMAMAIQIWFDLTRFRKDLSLCNDCTLQTSHFFLQI